MIFNCFQICRNHINEIFDLQKTQWIKNRMHDTLEMVMMATNAMSEKNATIQENYTKLASQEWLMSVDKTNNFLKQAI